MDRYAEELPDRIVGSIFFGGGTPSLMDPNTVGAVIDRIAKLWRLRNDVEITLEANPSSVEADKFSAFRNAGVNRVSLGVQALNDHDLQKLGRLHDVKQALHAVEIAQNTFNRCSFDLIYSRQNQSLQSWETELKTALTLGFSHLSLYQLTIEDGTAFGDRYARGKLRGLPSDDLAADMYDLTVDMMNDAGMPRYEVSNFAVPSQESRHNLIYWNYGDYIGIGPGAHGRLSLTDNSRVATETPLQPGKWLSSVEDAGSAESRNWLTPDEQAAEYILMGLRLRSGISESRFEMLAGRPMSSKGLTYLLEIDAIRKKDGNIIVKNQYVKLLNTVIERLLLD